MPRSRKVQEGGFFLIYRKNRPSPCQPRLAFARWTGKAVQRNRFKRWARHFLREKSPQRLWKSQWGLKKKKKAFTKT